MSLCNGESSVDGENVLPYVNLPTPHPPPPQKKKRKKEEEVITFFKSQRPIVYVKPFELRVIIARIIRINLFETWPTFKVMWYRKGQTASYSLLE